MNDVPEGVLAYVAISALVSLFIHWRMRRFFASCVVCFFLGPVAFVLACLARGESTPLPPVLVALLFATLSLLIAVPIGIPFYLVRRNTRGSVQENIPG
jgi:uncharacterized membrane protein YhhN